MIQSYQSYFFCPSRLKNIIVVVFSLTGAVVACVVASVVATVVLSVVSSVDVSTKVSAVVSITVSSLLHAVKDVTIIAVKKSPIVFSL